MPLFKDKQRADRIASLEQQLETALARVAELEKKVEKVAEDAASKAVEQAAKQKRLQGSRAKKSDA
jgi:hypothetical protein